MFFLRKRSVLPGFNLTLGYALLYLSLIVLIPLAGKFITTASLSWEEFGNTVTSPRVLTFITGGLAFRCEPCSSIVAT